MGSSSVLFGLSEGDMAVDLDGVVGGEVDEEGSMTMRSSVGWRA